MTELKESNYSHLTKVIDLSKQEEDGQPDENKETDNDSERKELRVDVNVMSLDAN